MSKAVLAPLSWAVVALFMSSAIAVSDPGNGKGHGHGEKGHPGHGQADYRNRGPSIDIGGIRIILRDNRDYLQPAGKIPPGIQKQLGRGKPLPPGIAKKVDTRLLGRLPQYDGYEWRQAGPDLLLVTVATGLIYEVIRGVLD
ncbi:anti-virulence regulator CigR family protein [Pseudomonas sp. Marseille-QA0892]